MSNNLNVIAKLEKNPKEIYEEARRLLIKIADNILKDPHNEKLRILQKGNSTISTKILGAYGGLDCLLSMGFQENNTFLKLPSDAPLRNVEQMRNHISQYKGSPVHANIQNTNAENDGASRGAVPKSSKNKLSTQTIRSELDNSDYATGKKYDLTALNSNFNRSCQKRLPLWNISLPASQRMEEIENAMWQEIWELIQNRGICKIIAEIPQKSESVAETINPVCIRLSEILDELLLVKRAKLETEQAGKSTLQMESKEEVVKRVVLPPFHSTFVNPFLRDVALRFHIAQIHDNKVLQERARKLIPLQELEVSAQNRLRIFQETIKKDKQQQELQISLQDMLILELLSWFKYTFFSWVDNPPCEQCAGETRFSHMCTDHSMLIYTDRIEMHKCDKCDYLTPFARYNDLNILMETRRGRCGEWANTFTLFCRAMGWDARHVYDETDHVWTEVYSFAQEHWLHCDPCENACDTPLMYESGWNKEVSYVMAYSGEEIQDVTWRYSSHHKLVLQRRIKCSEADLVAALVSLRQERQKHLSEARQKYLTKRLLNELVELMIERQPNEKDQQGRTSGSLAWRLNRGELQTDTENRHFVWKLMDDVIENEFIAVQYSAALNQYERITGTSTLCQTFNGWSMGVFDCVGMFRKEEKDWKVVYLSRQEGTREGRISWKFTVESADRSFDAVDIYFDYALFENGKIDVTVSDEYLKVLPFDHDAKSLKTCDFAGSKTITISAVLTGGRGDVAWQHAQLFRQSVNSKEYPFKVIFTFRKDV